MTRFFFLILWLGLIDQVSAQLEKVMDHYEVLEKKSKLDPQKIKFINNEMNLVEDYSKLSQIILLRHGEPALHKKGWRKRKEAKEFIRDYDSVGVYPPEYIPLELQYKELQVLYTSSLNRSISTAQQLFEQQDKQMADAQFREFERKIFSFFNIKLPLKWWLTGSRVLWFMGLNKKGIESFSEAKARAKDAASFLETDAAKNGKTLLVSHGLINHYLVKYLKKTGWTEVYDGGRGYLAQKMLVRYEIQN
ncbi:MAG: histidine phosphatase family protein [Bacteroidota bacterium]